MNFTEQDFAALVSSLRAALMERDASKACAIEAAAIKRATTLGAFVAELVTARKVAGVAQGGAA
jgi:hypothetical protein